MRTRAPPASRAATTRAMFVQLARLETLVPPNFRTIQAEGVPVTAFYVLAGACDGMDADDRAPAAAPAPTIGARQMRGVLQLVLVEVLQVFLELSVGQHFLEPAPGRLAALALVPDALVHAVEKTVVIGAVLGLSAQELIVEIEALVVPFRHLAV